MRWLSRFSASVFDRVRNESGAVIVFVAVAMVALLAMTAFVIDFGRIWQERRELQGGATAGVLAVAEDCARGMCDAAYNELATAEIYADANAIDGAASVFDIDLDLTDQTVRVVTATENTSGGDTMDMLFAGIVGFDTVTVGADAAAAWGTPLSSATVPLIISDCEWQKGEDPALYSGWPGGDPENLPAYDPDVALADYDPATMVTLIFHSTPGAEECNAGPGHDSDGDTKLPGGFGWLATSGGCSVAVTEDDWVNGKPGVAPTCSAAEFERIVLDNGPVLLPYFSDFEAGGVKRYEISGVTGFVAGGYHFTSMYTEFRAPLPGLPCGPPTHCLAGWFVNYVSNEGTTGDLGGDPRGFTVIKLIG